jgi:hypothetical protein
VTASFRRFLPGAAGAAIVLSLSASARADVHPNVQPLRHALVFAASGVSFEQLLAVPEVKALARSGGAALMSNQLARTDLLHVDGLPERIPGVLGIYSLPPPSEGLGELVRKMVTATGDGNVLVVVFGTSPLSPSMERTKDELFPLVVAEGPVDRLFDTSGAVGTLASDTTRRTGVVTDEDVVPTVLSFLGRPIPKQLDGMPLRIVHEPPPFDLHEKYLAMRRMSVPIQTAAGLYVTLGGLFGIAILWLGRRAPNGAARAAAWVALSVPVLGVALLAVGHLPTLSYATALPFVVAVTVVGTLAVVPLSRRDLLLAPSAIGAGVLLFFLGEAILGWSAALTPLFGGSELDGGRFFGLPNAYIGLLIGASLYLASRLSAWSGFALVAGVGLFAGLPFAGANLGAAVSLFAAAGLWVGLRLRGRFGWREAGLAIGVVIVGTAIVLVAHRFLTSTPTHVTRFEEGAGHSLGRIWGTFTHRLGTGWSLIERNPFALVPAIGLPVTLLVVLVPPPPIKAALARYSVWRDVLLVTLLAGIVAYVANDTGPAAAGIAFGMALGGLVYVSLIEGTPDRDIERE